jgi:plasmid stabilization system protein ParE
VRVEISKRAQRSIERIDTDWRQRADYPEIFREEMEELIEHLETVSNPGTPCNSQTRSGLRRMLLDKTKCHVYFVVNERRQWLEVLEVWDGRRKRSPKL